MAMPLRQIELKLIPAGGFFMGSPGREGYGEEHPEHWVHISRPFYLGVSPITQAQYQAVMGTNPSWFAAAGGGREQVAGAGTEAHPVEQVSWFDAIALCNRLSERKRLQPFYQAAGNAPFRGLEGDWVTVPDWNVEGFRLPTEAEWEYACRGGSCGRFSFGDDTPDLDEYAWFERNSGNRTHPVAQQRANAFGLFDMEGSVWEWCWDWFDQRYYAQSPELDPRGPARGCDRVLRGGSWCNQAWNCRASNRNWGAPRLRHEAVGFRLALNFRAETAAEERATE